MPKAARKPVEDESFDLEDEPNVNTAPPPVKRPMVQKTAAEAQADTLTNIKDSYVRIILEESEEIPPIGAYVGVNGKGYLIKPGVEVDVPLEVLEVLNNAVQSTPIINEQTRQIDGWRERLRYSYRLVPKKASR
mgnify:FL=1